ncbi:ATP-dependent helicase [Flavobacterium sp. LS1R49]|uniref:DNA 3'-5' helicase n=1 Tax=Flavobacterium shii TaxID=2987687 RepID=A0A9X2Z8R5_9FLAO|nr:ATP-dependent helicase [Flavobacterium shii]MCV9926251.1 ATP-dependent helicase [Flavobacterium shii]
MNSSFFEDLELIKRDQSQIEAYNSQRNTVVIAGPGSGKTRVLALKAASLAHGTIKKPSGLACISYSRETVREIKKRLKEYGYKPTNKDYIGTVHSFTLLHVIQPFAHLYPQYGVKYPVRIIKKENELKIFNSVLAEFQVSSKELKLMEINRQRSLSIVGVSQVTFDSTDLIVNAARCFEEKLLETEYLDFVSIINISAQIIREQEFVRMALRSRFPWLLVDEYQDLGKALHEMVLELVFNADIKLFAVGDMNQSIYGFNGGYPDFLMELMERDDIHPVLLTNNYRSNQHIIAASLETLEPSKPLSYFAKKRLEENPDFTFVTCNHQMDQQYDVVANKVVPLLIQNDVALNEIGIITWSNTDVRLMAAALRKNNIPFYISKWDFEKSATVTWLQECANWCIDPDKQSFENLFKYWKNLLINHNDPRKFLETIDLKVDFHKLLKKGKEKEIVLDWLSLMINNLELAKVLELSDMYPNEIANLQILLDEATSHNLKDMPLERFAHLGIPNNEVTITTRHSAKGLEFETVILLGMEEGHFPFYLDVKNPILLAEAQRLCYVCVSRAKKSCILVRSEKFTVDTKYGPKTHPYSPSRFWTTLDQKFGNENNHFTHINYPS